MKAVQRRWNKVQSRNPVNLWVDRTRADVMSRLSSPDFWYGRYPHTFLERRPPDGGDAASQVPEVIWCFWTGSNPLTPNRAACLAQMREVNPHTPVELITPERLPSFVVSTHPLHRAYDDLSLVHRSDYLRAYFLHHFGGGYSDLKQLRGPWRSALDRMRTSDAWLIGPPLTHPAWAGEGPGRLGAHLRRYYRRIASESTLIAKSHTPLTGEWLREVERRLDYQAPALAEAEGGIWGQEPGYPISWTGLLGDVLHPLCLKYGDRVVLDDSIAWVEDVPYR
ncbi:glycosyltransferase family 32 protein [Agromyces flavus]|nr:hypothetical protein [Agromyces flavus]GGI46686.1 hypothetical protein GCM10010932_15860 [Agromyces flavus]SDT29586.1 hypothetical protein SAMN04489721_3036 [Agromyces flavus]